MTAETCQWVCSGEDPLASPIAPVTALPDQLADAITEELVSRASDVVHRAAVVCELVELLHQAVTWIDDDQFAEQERRGLDYLLRVARSHRRRMTAISAGPDGGLWPAASAEPSC